MWMRKLCETKSRVQTFGSQAHEHVPHATHFAWPGQRKQASFIALRVLAPCIYTCWNLQFRRT